MLSTSKESKFKYKKLYYYASQPDKNSFIYLRILFRLTHEVELLINEDSLLKNEDSILEEETVLVLAREDLNEFVEIVRRNPRLMRTNKKRLYVMVEKCTQQFTEFNSKMLAISESLKLSHIEMPVYKTLDQVPEATFQDSKTLVVLYYDKMRLIEIIATHRCNSIIYPVYLFENMFDNDRRFLHFSSFKKGLIPGYIFRVGPFNQRAVYEMVSYKKEKITIWLSHFQQLEKYSAYSKPRDDNLFVIYSKTVKEDFSNFNPPRAKLKFFREEIEDISRGDELRILNFKIYQPKDSGDKGDETYVPEVVRKRWRKVKICLHNDVGKQFTEFCKIHWANIIQGKQFCNNYDVDFHVYRSKGAIGGEIPTGKHYIVADSDQPIYCPGPYFFSKSLKSVSLELQLEITEKEHLYRRLNVFVVYNYQIFDMLSQCKGMDFNLVLIENQEMPLLQLENHPFLVVVPEALAQIIYSHLKRLNGVLVILYEKNRLEVVQDGPLYIHNTHRKNTAHLPKIIKNFLEPNRPIFDIDYRLMPNSELLQITPDLPGLEDLSAALTEIGIQLKKSKGTIEYEGRAIVCNTESIYKIHDELLQTDRIFMYDKCPNYYKRFYDSEPSFRIISSSQVTLAKALLDSMNLKITKGLHRKENRVLFDSTVLIYCINDPALLEDLRTLYKGIFDIRQGEVDHINKKGLKGVPYLLLIESTQLPFFDECTDEKLGEGLVFVLERTNIKNSILAFCKLRRISIVTMNKKELVGQLSRYSTSEVQNRAKEFIKKYD